MRQLRHPNTLFALAAYDNFMVRAWAKEEELELADVMRLDDEADRLAQLVGRAYGYDTKHINSLETCEGCVRPGQWLRKQIGVPTCYPEVS